MHHHMHHQVFRVDVGAQALQHRPSLQRPWRLAVGEPVNDAASVELLLERLIHSIVKVKDAYVALAAERLGSVGAQPVETARLSRARQCRVEGTRGENTAYPRMPGAELHIYCAWPVRVQRKGCLCVCSHADAREAVSLW